MFKFVFNCVYQISLTGGQYQKIKSLIFLHSLGTGLEVWTLSSGIDWFDQIFLGFLSSENAAVCCISVNQ